MIPNIQEFGLASLTNRELYDWRCTLEEGEAKTVYRRQARS